ncbi:MAG: glycosyltransferase family 2 protein [Planctomycetota bacterium]
MTKSLEWSVILPTYRRQDVLRQSLERLAASDLPKENAEVLIYDNGSPQDSQPVVESFAAELPIRYTNNGVGHGLGYSLTRGATEATGRMILEMNDDALVPSDLFARLSELFNGAPGVGVIGVRALEDGYHERGSGIGRIDPQSLEVIGNFDRTTDGPIDVEHVYGFCYAYMRDVVAKGAGHDQVLLARDYSSGTRIETDQCLMARRAGFRVVYDGSIAVVHLAKPRGDMDEFSPRWRLNHIRNTLYLYLKHFGWFGRSCMGIRFCFLHDLGLLSFIKRPTKSNWLYFWISIRARASGIWHWLRYVFGSSSSSLSERQLDRK